MASKLSSSELVLNPDGSIYHCNIKPEELADTIILVGDQNRVSNVSKYFDAIETRSQKREIIVNTGILNQKRLTVISTGMGTDNIDIVLNELDALANIDLKKKEIKPIRKQLTFVRLGTSGAIQKDIPVDTIVASTYGLGFDGLMSFYANTESFYENPIAKEFIIQTKWNPKRALPYLAEGSEELLHLMTENSKVISGITATAIGFYGPQGRILRLNLDNESMNEQLTKFTYNNNRITNFEMETSAIYGLSHLMGHKALSLNTIVTNRYSGTFSKDPYSAIDSMIQFALEKLTKF
ncbi:nucleoside phosphorylase [Apibacter adventoris]|uniref:Uridine phosphorylase n=1 Tax=Apibacter adventoris TaxID=1679466 RepID=A0A2S8AEA1_9FLAO|nr:nucleoside phosphorylase [Apibacter adventoris]PQL93429.1 phosphorylase [Apibacter adventoris]